MTVRVRIRTCPVRSALFLTVRPQEYIAKSSAIIVFLSGSLSVLGAEVSDYMRSKNCMRELNAAMLLHKPIIVVLETDGQHGGVSLASHMDDARCPPQFREQLLSGEGRVLDSPVIMDGGNHDAVAPYAEAAVEAAAESSVDEGKIADSSPLGGIPLVRWCAARHETHLPLAACHRWR